MPHEGSSKTIKAICFTLSLPSLFFHRSRFSFIASDRWKTEDQHKPFFTDIAFRFNKKEGWFSGRRRFGAPGPNHSANEPTLIIGNLSEKMAAADTGLLKKRDSRIETKSRYYENKAQGNHTDGQTNDGRKDAVC